MKKRFLRCISLLLAIVMLTEMLPTAWFASFLPQVYAADADMPAETYTLPVVSPTDNTVTAEIPPTIVDETDDEPADMAIDDSTDAGTSGTDVSDVVKVPKPEWTENDSHFVAILKQSAAFSALSAEDAAFFVDYTRISAASFAEMEADGLSLGDSVTYGTLAMEAECTVAAVLARDPSMDDVQNITQELAILNALLRDELSGTALAYELKQHVLHGHSCAQVLNAYGVSQVFGISMANLLDSDTDMPSGLSAAESQKLEAFGASLDIAAAPLAEYAVKNGLSADAIESRKDEIAQKRTEILFTPQSSGGGSGESENVENPYISAPYTYNSGENEKVSLNSGALIYESTDYVLPGINGLDLVITRRYDSQNAGLGRASVEVIRYGYYVYYVVHGAVAYYNVPGFGTGRWPAYDMHFPTAGPFKTQAEADRYADSCQSEPEVYPDYQDGADLIITYYTYVISSYVDNGYDANSITKPNNYFQKLYGLGCGWNLTFSSIETVDGKKYLHLSTGKVYEINTQFDASNPQLTLKDYPLADLKLTETGVHFSNGSESAKYCLTYQDGKREYFNADGKLIGIQDRYENTITLVHTRKNGYPHIAITDTLGRETVISGISTETGHSMTIQLPDGKTLTYELLEQNNSCVLASYLDVVGNKTSYSYTKSSASFNVMTGEASEGRNTYLNLTTVTHPTNAQSIYTYEKTKRNLGEKGTMEVYRLVSRKDFLEGEELNCQTFCYSENDCSGYPSIRDPEKLSDTYQYSASVTTPDHTVTTTTFNHKHLPILVECHAGDSLRRKTQYIYDSRKQPIRQEIQCFSAENQNQPFTVITASEYDSKGNLTAGWTAQANGSTADAEYRTSYTYDDTYGLLLTKTYKTDADTTIEIRNTLDSSKKNIIRTEVFRNGVKTACTEYDHDAYGNVTCERRYHDDFTAYDTTQYTYDRNAYLSQEKHTGILTADGADVASTPGQPAGTITTDYAYDVLGRMTSVTDGNGDTTAYTYDAAGNVTLCTNPDGTSVRYDRDYSGNKLTVTDENGAQIRYTYTPLGLEYETIDVQTDLVMSRKEYDAQSRLSRLSDFVNGAVTEYTYDTFDRILSETVLQGTQILSQTLYSYDDAAEGGLYQKVTKTIVGDETAPSVITTQYTDKCGNVVKTGRFLNGTEYLDTFGYDYLGNKLWELSAADAAKNLPFTAKYEYNESSQVIKTYNAAGQFTENTYNALGQLIQTTDYVGTPTLYSYDALGRLLSQTVTVEDGVTAVSKYAYDASGNIICEWKPVQAVGAAAEWSKSEYAYNSRKKLISAKQYDGSVLASETTYTYDGVGNMLSMNAGGSTTSYTYDRFGNVLTMTDALGQTETSTYAALGRLESRTDRNGTITSYTYDALGRVLSTTAHSGEDTETVTRSYTLTGQVKTEENASNRTQYLYDELGRVVRVAESAAGTPEVPVDPVPVPQQYTVTLDANGGTVEPASAQVRGGELYVLPEPVKADCTFSGWYLNGETYAAGTAVEITGDCTFAARWEENTFLLIYYSNYGEASGLTEEGRMRSYACAEAVEILENPFRDVPDKTARFAGWSYSKTSKNADLKPGDVVKDLCHEAGGVVELYAVWEYPAAELPDKPIVDLSADIAIPETSFTYLKTYTYDLAGNRTRFTVTQDGAELQKTNYLYDDLNRLTAVYANGGTQAAYTYDTNGNRASLTYANGVTETYRYNKANWVILLENRNKKGVISSYAYTYYASGSQKTKTTAGGTVTSYVYDGLNRLIQEAETGALTQGYTYDARGNRASMTVSGKERYTVSYAYDANNRLLTERKTRGLLTDLTTYAYDANGNLLSKTFTGGDGSLTGATYTYNLFGQLTAASENGLIAAYAYNAQGIRTCKATATSQTYFLLDGGNVTGERTGSKTVTYLRGANLISRSGDGKATYYLFNAHGDVTELVSDSSTVTHKYDYDAFGVEKKPDPLDGNPFRYCGEYYDGETKTYYLRARYYDPNIGRFTQQDSVWLMAREYPNGQKITDPLSLNLYVYCANNPIVYGDPSGHAFETLLDIAGLILSAIDFIKEPSWENAAFLLWDAAGVLIPFVPGSYAGKGVKVLGKIDDVADAVKTIDHIDDAAKAAIKITNKLDDGVDIIEFVSSGNRLIGSYKDMKKYTKGYNGAIQAHHLLEQRFCRAMGLNVDDMISVVLTKEQHSVFTKLWRDAVNYIGDYSDYKNWASIREIAKEVYADYPELFMLLDGYMKSIGK